MSLFNTASLCLCLAAVSVSAATQPKLRDNLTFYAGFDNGSNAVYASGNGVAEVHGQPETTDGVFGGQALIFRSKGDSLSFDAKDNFSRDCGSISLWVKDLEAKPIDRIWNPYFQMLAGKDAIYVTRMWQGIEQTGGLWRNQHKIAIACDQEELVIKDMNEWHHLALVWRHHALDVYRDGKLAAYVPDVEFILTEAPELFQIGRPADPVVNADTFHSGYHMLKDAPAKAAEMKISEEPFGAIAIDEVAVFNRPLNAAEIAKLASLPVNEALDTTSEFDPGRLHVALINSRRQIRLLASAEVLPAPDATAWGVICDADGKRLKEVRLPWSAKGADYTLVPLEGMADGNYTAVAEFRSQDGTVLGLTAPTAFSLTPPEEWLGNTLGIEDKVLPGLFPMETGEDEIRFWGRTLTGFAKSVFPSSIVNQGHEMLTRPITWQWEGPGGTKSSLEFDSVTRISSSQTKALYQADGHLGQFAVHCELLAEYDGFMRYKMTFEPPQAGLETASLKMVIPLVPQESTLFFIPEMRNAAWPANGASYAITPIYKNSAPTIGNPERCLQFITESDQYFYPEDAPNALQLETAESEHVFSVAVIAAPFTVKDTISLDFVLQTGPVKPRPPHWRGWTYVPGQRAYLDPRLHKMVTSTYTWWCRAPGEPIPGEGFPEPPDPTFRAGEIPFVSMHFAGYRDFKTADLQTRTPEWAKYEAEWQRNPKRINIGAPNGWNEQTVDTKAQSWGDWHIWCVDKLFRTTGIRGLYYDDWVQGDSSNELAGSGYIGYSGTRRATRDIYNQREFHRRIFNLIKTYRPDDGIVTIHTSGCIFMPIVSFCDIIYDGEVMIWPDRIPPKGQYFDTYDKTIVQLNLSAKMYGPVQALHDMTSNQASTEIGTWQQLMMYRQRQLWAILLANDIQVHGGFTQGADALRYIWLDHFGIAEDDVQFIGYWDPKPVINFRKAYWDRPTGPDEDRTSTGYGSVYLRPGKALLVLIRDADNNYYGPAKCEYEIDWERLGFSPDHIRLTDLESLGRTPKGTVDGNVLTVDVGVDDFSLVLVEATDGE